MREKEIISTDNETGGAVVMDRIPMGQEKFVVVMEAKRSSDETVFVDNNGGEVYGFVTTGDT